jgi:hypothetical protein
VVGSVTISGGTGSTSISTLSVGTHDIFAAYTSDGNVASSSSATVHQVVNSATVSTTTNLTDNGPNPSYGQAVSYTVNTTNVPNGQHVYLEDASNSNAIVGSVSISGGTGSTSVSGLSIGTHEIFAVYGGEAGYTSSQSGQVLQTVDAISVTSVVINRDYAPVLDFSNAGTLGDYTVTVTTDGNNGFSSGNNVVIAGETGNQAGYNGTWSLSSVSGDTFQFTDTNVSGQTATTFNSNGYAISQNTSSALTGVQRSMVDSVMYTFNTGVSSPAGALTIGVQGGVTTLGAATLATGVPNQTWTVVPGTSNTTWVMTFTTGVGNTVTGHSIANGAYTLNWSGTVTPAGGGTASTPTQTPTTETFYRMYGDYNGRTGSFEEVIGPALTQFDIAYETELGTSGYNPVFDVDGNGKVIGPALTAFDVDYESRWSGFTPTI